MSPNAHRVRSGDATVRQLVGAMFDLVLAEGGAIHPGVWVEETDGSLSVHVDGADGSVLGAVLDQVLVPIDRVGIEVVDDRLVVVSPDDRLTAVQREALDVHLRLYNATGKAPWARTMLPEVALAGADLELVARLRGPGHLVRSVADAFMATRTLARRVDPEVQQGDPGVPPGDPAAVPSKRPVLMPLLDLINHHPLSSPFGGSRRSIAAKVSHPLGGTEAFVSYGGRRTPIDTALRYGFVPDGTRITRLRAVQVEVGGLLVRIEGRTLHERSVFDPPIVAIDGSMLTLSHLSVDADHPQRMEAALSLALHMASRSMGVPSVASPGPHAVLAQLLRADRAVVESVRDGLTSSGPARRVIEDAIAVHTAIIDEAAVALGLTI